VGLRRGLHESRLDVVCLKTPHYIYCKKLDLLGGWTWVWEVGLRVKTYMAHSWSFGGLARAALFGLLNRILAILP
jgi:hypothetical protein